MRRILREGRKYLNDGGRMYVSWANFADFEFIEELARTEKYRIRLIAEQGKEEIVYRVYELRF